VIRESLAGKRLFITGTTGFLGTNLLERLLRAVPDCDIVLLVRPGRRSTVQQRVAREILKNDAFDRLRADLGKDGFAEMTDATGWASTTRDERHSHPATPSSTPPPP